MTVKFLKAWSDEQQPDRRLHEMQEKKKPILLKELENELRHLDEMEEAEFLPNQDPTTSDLTLSRLQMISREAKKL